MVSGTAASTDPASLLCAPLTLPHPTSPTNSKPATRMDRNYRPVSRPMKACAAGAFELHGGAPLCGGSGLRKRERLDIGYIRAHADEVKRAVARKRFEVDIDRLLALDAERRANLGEVNGLRQKRNELSELIPKLPAP